MPNALSAVNLITKSPLQITSNGAGVVPVGMSASTLNGRHPADKVYVRSLIEDTRTIFDVAGAATATDAEDFVICILPDGGLHFVMEAPSSIDGAAAYVGARTAFHVTRNQSGVRVLGQNAATKCVIEQRRLQRELLPDQPFYRMTSPLLTSGTTSS